MSQKVESSDRVETSISTLMCLGSVITDAVDNLFQSIQDTHSLRESWTKPPDTKNPIVLSTENEKRSEVHSKGGRTPQESAERFQTLMSLASP